jgi:hypothetical protein
MTDLTPYSLFIAIVVVIGAVNMLAMIMFIKRVRTNYPNLYNNIGRPTLLPERSFIEQWHFVRFIMRRDYNQLDDAKLKLLGNTIFFANLLIIGLMAFGSIFQFKLGVP